RVVAAGAAKELRGRLLQRDEQVRGDGGGRMVGGAVVLGDLEGAHPELLRQGAGEIERPLAGPGDGGGGALHGGLAVGERLEGVDGEALGAAFGRRGQGIEGGGPAHVAEQRRGIGDRLAGLHDRRVGNAEEDGVRPSNPGGMVAAGEADVEIRALSRSGQRAADAATADERQRRGARHGWEGIPFQFPHRRYQTVRCLRTSWVGSWNSVWTGPRRFRTRPTAKYRAGRFASSGAGPIPEAPNLRPPSGPHWSGRRTTLTGHAAI